VKPSCRQVAAIRHPAVNLDNGLEEDLFATPGSRCADNLRWAHTRQPHLQPADVLQNHEAHQHGLRTPPKNLGHIDVVIINSAWCGYAPDAKFHCRKANVSLFKIGELMGAMYRDDYWRYLTDGQKESYKNQGWL
jgi:hypothetical protein